MKLVSFFYNLILVGFEKIVGTIADLHFAPTEKAAEALRRENVAQSAIHVTGNTVIDALFATRDRVRANPALASRIQPVLDQFDGRKVLLVTTHRRENFGMGLQNIVDSVGVFAEREDLACVIPVHLNPNVRAVVEERLAGNPSIALLEPLDYANFTWLLAHADIVLTDSGGLQEEAPAFDKPVLVMRETTERPEGVDNGTALLVGTDSRKIETEVHRLLDDPAGYGAMASAPNPFGNGKAAKLICDIIVSVMKG